MPTKREAFLSSVLWFWSRLILRLGLLTLLSRNLNEKEIPPKLKPPYLLALLPGHLLALLSRYVPTLLLAHILALLFRLVLALLVANDRARFGRHVWTHVAGNLHRDGKNSKEIVRWKWISTVSLTDVILPAHASYYLSGRHVATLRWHLATLLPLLHAALLPVQQNVVLGCDVRKFRRKAKIRADNVKNQNVVLWTVA